MSKTNAVKITDELAAITPDTKRALARVDADGIEHSDYEDVHNLVNFCHVAQLALEQLYKLAQRWYRINVYVGDDLKFVGAEVSKDLVNSSDVVKITVCSELDHNDLKSVLKSKLKGRDIVVDASQYYSTGEFTISVPIGLFVEKLDLARELVPASDVKDLVTDVSGIFQLLMGQDLNTKETTE